VFMGFDDVENDDQMQRLKESYEYAGWNTPGSND